MAQIKKSSAGAGLTGVDGIPGVNGVDGIPGEQGPQGPAVSWKEPVANEAALPVNTETPIKDSWGYPAAAAGVAAAINFVASGPGTYKAKVHIIMHEGIYNAYIYSDSAGLPGEDIGIAPVEGIGVINEDMFVIFNDVNLTNGVPYWIVFVIISGDSGIGVRDGYGSGTLVQSNDSVPPITNFALNTGWSINHVVYSATINAVEGDVRYAETEKTTWAFDGTTWVSIKAPAANQPDSVEMTNPTVAEFNVLLAALKSAGLMMADT